MAGAICVGALAAFGCLSALWILVGWLLYGVKSDAVVCLYIRETRQEREILRYRWFRDLGLVTGRILVVDCGLPAAERSLLERKYSECVFYCPEELASGLELERKRFD